MKVTSERPDFLEPYRPDGREFGESPEVLARVDEILLQQADRTEPMERGHLVGLAEFTRRSLRIPFDTVNCRCTTDAGGTTVTLEHVREAIESLRNSFPPSRLILWPYSSDQTFFDQPWDVTQYAYLTWDGFPLRVRCRADRGSFILELYAPHPTEGAVGQSVGFSREFLEQTDDCFTPIFHKFIRTWHSRPQGIVVPYRAYWRGENFLDAPFEYREDVRCELEFNEPGREPIVVKGQYPPSSTILHADPPSLSSVRCWTDPVNDLPTLETQCRRFRFLGWLPTRRAYYREEPIPGERHG